METAELLKQAMALAALHQKLSDAYTDIARLYRATTPVVWYDANRVTSEQAERLRVGDSSVIAELPKGSFGDISQ